MQYKIIVDAFPIILNLWNKYDGDLSQKQWLKKESKNILDSFKNKINTYTNNEEINIAFDATNKEIIITFSWQQKENINEWIRQVKEEINKLIYHLSQLGLNVYYKVA